MKKTPLLNSNISSVISRMGQTETLAVIGKITEK